jgi:hypothetical protein
MNDGMVISMMAFEREQLAYIKSAVFSHKDNSELERLTSHGISHALDFSVV